MSCTTDAGHFVEAFDEPPPAVEASDTYDFDFEIPEE